MIGIHHSMDEATYHGDPCPAPSLSSSIAKLLVRRSPMHAAHAHPRLNPDCEPFDPTPAMDAGTILHKMLLGAGMEIEPVVVRQGPKSKRPGELVTDWKTDAAQEARDAVRAAGRIPVLPHVLDELTAAAAAARRQIERHPEGRMLFEPGHPEATLIWREGPIWCRARVDYLLGDPKAPPLDLKTTELSAAPQSWERRVQTEYAFQAAFYRRGLAMLRGSTPPMRFIVVEQQAPHGVSVLTPAPSLSVLADAEVDRAIRIWARCIEAGEWPGYPPLTAHVEAKPWQAMEAEEQALRDDIMENAL